MSYNPIDFYIDDYNKDKHFDFQNTTRDTIKGYTTKTMPCGDYAIIDIYAEHKQASIKRLTTQKTSEIQRKANQNKCEKHITAILCANFEPAKSLMLTLTYKNNPKDKQEANKHYTSYIKRLKRLFEFFFF